METQEDKQAKALKEIYKLCKTEEASDSGDNLPIYYGEVEHINPKEEDNESENSEQIQNLFNKINDDQYDINKDVDLQDNLKKHLSHSELLRMRKNFSTHQQMGGRNNPSLQSELTDSVEVSEKSYNDKLAKLQIHSF